MNCAGTFAELPPIDAHDHNAHRKEGHEEHGASIPGGCDPALLKPFDVEELGARLTTFAQTHGDQNDEIRSDNADVVDTSHEKQYINGPGVLAEVLLDGASN